MKFSRGSRLGILAAVVLAGLTCTKIRQVKDAEARTFYQKELAVFLDSLVYQMCQVKYAWLSNPANAGKDIPGRVLCPGASVSSPATPLWGVLAKAAAPDGKDSPVRTYIRNDLQPWIDSVTYNLCHIKAAAAPAAPGRFICPGPPDGYKKPPANGAP